MNHAEALEKAKKLLRLSQSSNPHEAALAASRAQEIIDRFKIESISLELDDKNAAQMPDEPIKDFRADPLDDSGRAETWKYRLASEIAKQNQCKLYSCRGICIIGRPSDATAVRYLFAWLSREIDRLANAHCAGYGRNYFNNFRIGAAETVARRLAEQKQSTLDTIRAEARNEKVVFRVGGQDGREFSDLESAKLYEAERRDLDGLIRPIYRFMRPQDNSRAIVLVEQSLAQIEQRAASVDAWTKANVKLRSGKTSGYRGNYEARNAGRQAGHSVRMQPSAGNLKSSQRSLGCI